MHVRLVLSSIVVILSMSIILGSIALSANAFAQDGPGGEGTPSAESTASPIPSETQVADSPALTHDEFCHQDRLDTAKLSAAISDPSLSALTSAKFTEMDETNVAVEVAGYKAIITGAGEVLLFRFSSDVPEEIQSAIHRVADEVNNAC